MAVSWLRLQIDVEQRLVFGINGFVRTIIRGVSRDVSTHSTQLTVRDQYLPTGNSSENVHSLKARVVA